MAQIRNKKKPLLLQKTERLCISKPHRCFRTECLMSALVVGLLAMFVTWGSSTIVKAGYELVQARACLTKIEKQNELLRLEMAQLKSPQRIQSIAVEQLNMVNPPTLYLAARDSASEKTAPERTSEIVTAQRFILFGGARAEAHKMSE